MELADSEERRMKDRLATQISRWVVCGVGLGGAALMCYGGVFAFAQANVWLRTAIWVPLPVKYMFVHVPIKDTSLADPVMIANVGRLRSLVPFLGTANLEAWLGHPNSWLGLHRVVLMLLDYLPVSGSEFLVGVFLVMGALKALDELGSQRDTSSMRLGEGGYYIPTHPSGDIGPEGWRK
jgi:hypothetical protein